MKQQQTASNPRRPDGVQRAMSRSVRSTWIDSGGSPEAFDNWLAGARESALQEGDWTARLRDIAERARSEADISSRSGQRARLHAIGDEIQALVAEVLPGSKPTDQGGE